MSSQVTLSLIEANPLYKPWIERAFQSHTPQELVPYLQRGLQKEAQFWDSEAKEVEVGRGFDRVLHILHIKKKKLYEPYRSYAQERRDLLNVLEKEGPDGYLRLLP